jgi:hypothetical protein
MGVESETRWMKLAEVKGFEDAAGVARVRNSGQESWLSDLISNTSAETLAMVI